MKRNRINLIIIAGALAAMFLAGCSALGISTGQEVGGNPLAGTEWQLTEYQGSGVLQAARPDHRPTINFEDGNASGSTGCNSFSTQYSLDGNGFSSGETAVTEMACMESGVMEQEAAFLSLLRSTDTYTLSGSSLELSGPEGVLRFEPFSEPEPAALEGNRWELTILVTKDGDAVTAQTLPSGALVTALFEEDGTISGSTGCNSYGGTYNRDGNQLDMPEPWEMTAAQCPDEAGNQLERQFVEAMQSVESYRITEQHLTLIYPGGELVFQISEGTLGKESAVLESILRSWTNGSGLHVLLDQSQYNQPGVPLDETTAEVEGQVTSMLELNELKLDPTTLENFRAANQTSSKLSGTLETSLQIAYITPEEVDELFQGGDAAGWETFQERYPEAEGIFSLSRVGLNESGDQALVYLSLRTPQYASGWYSLLGHSPSGWGTGITFNLWGE